ncbi:hypothetical protein FY030_11555 [Ornithinimicrobium pratense]|uniref:Uncharacterized protein n=1 Tax=Ornithinimicrobium pratense TaxID=2593973 RepID=A0A5J6V652_9MICO|nr:hypothetical protein FY030_11555 [Ornithinimicrobium pratense]
MAPCPAATSRAWIVAVTGPSSQPVRRRPTCAGDRRSVTVIERDVLPSEPEPRPGVSQGRQPHVLLYRGPAEEAAHDADLAVDATGRGSRLPTWLTGLGIGSVDVTEVDPPRD